MLEEKIGELIEVIAANTAALNAAYGTSHTELSNIDRMKKEIGDKERAMHEENTDAESTETPVKKSKKKASKKKTAKKSEAVEPAATQTSQTAETSTQAPLDKEKVQTHIRGIASQLKDTGKLFALIQKHGAQQFSDLDPSVYEALIADAEQLVADGE